MGRRSKPRNTNTRYVYYEPNPVRWIYSYFGHYIVNRDVISNSSTYFKKTDVKQFLQIQIFVNHRKTKPSISFALCNYKRCSPRLDWSFRLLFFQKTVIWRTVRVNFSSSADYSLDCFWSIYQTDGLTFHSHQGRKISIKVLVVAINTKKSTPF